MVYRLINSFSCHVRGARAHSLRVKDDKLKVEKGNIFFTHGLKPWNSLSQNVSEAKNVARFKEKLNAFVEPGYPDLMLIY